MMEKFSRRAFCGAGVAALAGSAAFAQNATQNATQNGALQLAAEAVPPDTEEQRIAELVIANHILADQGVLDSYGHVTVRSLKNPKHYWMSANKASGLVTKADILEFDENSQPINANGRRTYNERYIHGEVYRVRPDVMCVVHSHSPDVLPYTVTDQPLKALIHMAHFIGSDPVPKFDLEDVEGPHNGMLLLNTRAGAAMAKALGNRNVVLLRGHGMTVVGPTIRRAVYNAVYTQENARVESEALKLGKPKFLNEFEVQRRGEVNRAWDAWSRQAAITPR
jgi:HCOMODA/2-hydroxy-3-carboxy-muconic semialdehyde decarboxylase